MRASTHSLMVTAERDATRATRRTSGSDATAISQLVQTRPEPGHGREERLHRQVAVVPLEAVEGSPVSCATMKSPSTTGPVPCVPTGPLPPDAHIHTSFLDVWPRWHHASAPMPLSGWSSPTWMTMRPRACSDSRAPAGSGTPLPSRTKPVLIRETKTTTTVREVFLPKGTV